VKSAEVKTCLIQFPTQDDLKHGDVLWPLLFNFASDYAVRKVEYIQERLELKRTHQLLVCGCGGGGDDDDDDDDDVNTLDEDINTI